MNAKVRLVLNLIRFLPSNLYMNFHYLPWKQAIKLPILLYKPKLLKCKGSIQLACPVRFGIIRMGFHEVSLYPNNGVTWENHGGEIVFRGHTLIGNDSYLSFGQNTKVTFGDDFKNTAGLKIASYHGIEFGKGTRLGWGVTVMDTNFHPLYDIKKGIYKRAGGKIVIGDYNWFGTQCKIMHSTVTPERCIFGIGSVVTRGCIKESYCVMGGNPIQVLTRDVMRDYNHDTE